MTKISKILYIITQSSWGGAQKYVFDLASELKKKHPEMTIIVAGGQESIGQLTDKLNAAGIEFRPLKNLVRDVSPKKLVQDILAINEIKKLINTEKPDIVHLNSSKASVIGALASALATTPHKLVYTVHGWVFNEDISPIKKLIYRTLEKITARPKDLIINLSEKNRQATLKNNIVKDNKTVVIYNGVAKNDNTTLSKEAARKEIIPQSIIDEPRTIIGTIANFYPTKDLDNLIDATKILNDKGLKIITVIIGDGRLRSALEEKIKKLNLQDKIILVGEKNNASRLLKAFDIYVCSSSKEGLPFSILEALQAKLAVVSTNVGDISEIIIDQKNGLLVPAKNPQRLARAIENLLIDNNLKTKLENNSASSLNDKFSLAKMVTDTEQAYEKLLSLNRTDA